MSRHISFRCWDTKANRWLEEVPPEEYMLDCEYTLDCDDWGHPDDGDMVSMTYPASPLPTFGGRLLYEQDTRLQDIHGKPVFEGDICRERWTAPAGEMESTYVVRFGHYTDGEGFPNVGFCVDYTLRAEPLAGQSGGNLRPRNSRWEVIGNVHEHAHLLKRDTP